MELIVSQPCSINDKNLQEKMESVLPDIIFQLIQQIGCIADRKKTRAYLVGGLVRDLLLGISHVDLDIVIEGDGLSFAMVLAEVFSAKIISHKKFATATILFSDGSKIDVATARTEYYEFPASLPTIETGSLEQDLYRRDFTINAMAVGLNQDNFGQLVDFFCGKSDLQQGIIRVLYHLSFVEDPTRIIRGIRFEKKYGFQMEPETEKFALQAIKHGFVEKLSFSRIKEEFILILQEEYPVPILEKLDELGIWDRVFPEWPLSVKVKNLLKDIPDELLKSKDYLTSPDIKLIYLLSLCHHCSESQVNILNAKFQWSKRYRIVLTKTASAKEKIFGGLKLPNLTPGVVYSLMNDLTDEAVFYFYLLSNDHQKNIIRDYLDAKKNSPLSISGEDLIQLGIRPGPKIRELLDRVKKEKIEGNIHSRVDEITFLQKIINRERGD